VPRMQRVFRGFNRWIRHAGLKPVVKKTPYGTTEVVP
jgi:hypothetical protein